mmetsp:Transcript_9202/g.13622  ORF Transcript_9202/g.13622 Transcript_9202/m.13622 type:complete len:219 (-) Transcript_9202:222-878(-)
MVDNKNYVYKMTCEVCNQKKPSSVFKACSQCYSSYYCSKSCQIKDWKEKHKKICKRNPTRSIFTEYHISEYLGKTHDELIMLKSFQMLQSHHDALDTSEVLYKKTKYSDCIYYSFYNYGFELAFDNQKGQWRVATISLFCQGYGKKYKYSFAGRVLDNKIHFAMSNVQVVQHFGEPSEKGGIHVPVWLSYDKHKFSVEFFNKSFDDRHNPLISINLWS